MVTTGKPEDNQPEGGREAVDPRISSFEHPMSRLARNLLSRPERERLGKIIIDDEENVLQALKAGVDIEALFYSGNEKPTDDLRERLPDDVPLYEIEVAVSKRIFKKERLSRLFAIARTPPPLDLEALASLEGDIVVLEEVSIMGNIGAIIRTSLALGVGAIVLLNLDHVDLYDRRLIRASRGYVFGAPVVTAPTDEFLRFCKEHGIDLLVTTPLAEVELEEIAPLPQRFAIVFGSEKEGCSPEVMEAATVRASIPTRDKVESLNVSVAAAITLYSRMVSRRRA